MRQRFVPLLGLALLAATACADAGRESEQRASSGTSGAAGTASSAGASGAPFTSAGTSNGGDGAGVSGLVLARRWRRSRRKGQDADHPYHLRVIPASRKKTDKRDASWLAKTVQSGMTPHPVRIPTGIVRQLRALLNERDTVTRQRRTSHGSIASTKKSPSEPRINRLRVVSHFSMPALLLM
jgi:hypothetical protein